MSDAGRKFYEPDSEAAGYCTTYGTHSVGSCTNTLCTSSSMVGPNLGNKCASPNQKSGPKYTKCLIRDYQDLIVDCCQNGTPVNGVCPGGVTATPTATATPVPTAHYCSTYGTFPKNSCTNLQCPTGRYCAVKLLTGAAATFCLSRTATSDQMMSCCAAGSVINAAGNACVIVGATQTPTPTPTKHECDYGSNPKGTCSNTSCDIGGSGLDCRTEWVANALRRKCLSASTTDMIKDCCGAGSSVKGSAGSYYCQANVTPTPTPTKINCQTYGVWSLNACSNPTCSTASIQRCVPQLVSGASEVKCANRTDGVDEIRDCCPSGKVLNSAKTACVTVAATTVPATTVPATTVPPTGSPTLPQTTVPPTGTPTVTTSITTTPPTGSVTGTATPTLTATPTTTLPPTTSPTTNRTPSVTHTPSETGFADDILMYLGGAFYAIGVLAFVLARFLGVSRRPTGKRV